MFRSYAARGHITHLIPCSGVLLDKLIVTQLFQKLTAFYGTRMFNTVFTGAR